MSLADIDVFILAAGFGKRLGELTTNTPKPLVKVAGRALLDRNLELLQSAGFRRVCINLHYRGEQIREFVGDGSHWGLDVTYSEESVLLDTGGGIKNIEPWLRSDHFFTVNGDVVVDERFPFREVYEWHCAHQPVAVATLVLRADPEAARYGEFGIDGLGRVCEFLGRVYEEAGEVRRGLMYTGIQCLSRRILELMPPRGSAFSITKDTYTQILTTATAALTGYIYIDYWSDAGTPGGLAAAENFFLKKPLS